MLKRSRQPRSGGHSLGQILALASPFALVVLLILLYWDSVCALFQKRSPPRPLIVYVAAVMTPTVEAIGKEYETAYGVPVLVRSGGSGSLLSQIEIVKSGDLFIPADSDYLEIAAGRGLVDEILPAATMKGMLAVRAGNPKNLHRLEDLLADDVILAQPDPDAAAVGKVTRAVLSRSRWWDQLAAKKKRVNTLTVTEAANAVQLGGADAAIVWDVTVQQTPGIEGVILPELAEIQGSVGVGVLTCSDQPTAALRFARFLTARDRGLPHLARAGFAVIPGDAWTETPLLHLQANPDLRPVVENAIDDFERRESAHVLRVYDLPTTATFTITNEPHNKELATRLSRAVTKALESRHR